MSTETLLGTPCVSKALCCCAAKVGLIKGMMDSVEIAS